ncbi:MAG: hypothetical protein JJU02_12060, partial [Cryomorphaceae bacterium]|nr:hypothetical protein [Cryomorphaceae bacterium]
MKTMKLISLIIATTLLSLCKKDRHDDELHLQQTPYLGDELRIDGFYFREKEHSNSTQVFFLYSNGIILGGSSFQNPNWEQNLINAINSGSYRNTTLKYKDSWGLFEIEDSILRFEKWYPNSPGPKRAFVREGVILNDTT